jgi:hypothetical protein
MHRFEDGTLRVIRGHSRSSAIIPENNESEADLMRSHAKFVLMSPMLRAKGVTDGIAIALYAGA